MKFLKKILFLLFFLFPFSFVFAVGNIDSTNYKAKLLSDDSLINFGYFATNSDKNVTVTNSELTGYIWGENIGWISLNCSNNSSCGSSNFKVSNTTGGSLSGYAWGENSGWVNFGPFNNSSAQTVSIASNGNFDGYAWSQNFGWIEFDCESVDSCVTTTWRPVIISTGGGGTGGNDNILPTLTVNNPVNLINNYPNIQSVTLSASAEDTDGSIIKIWIFINNQFVALVNNSDTISIPWTPPSLGYYELKYRALDNSRGDVYSDTIILNFGSNFCEINPTNYLCISPGDDDPVDDPVDDEDPVDDDGGPTDEDPNDEEDPYDEDDPIDDDGDVLVDGDGGGVDIFDPVSGCEYETTILGVIWCTIIDTYD